MNLPKETKEILEALAPELCESEDERIRVRLIEYFKGFLEGYEDCYKDGGCVKWEGLDVKSILAWLEKQKETADSFTDGIIEVRSFQRGMEEGRRLERQKENSKSADSISSDCESNAKCENRWHKVEDSLPDSTREVLCKDAIGNYFIGRYYSKGVWEVSMYDDCDKSNEDNPPVVKWCEIPSEKQKEQKPAQSEEEKEYVRTLKGLVSDFIRNSGGGITDVEYYQNICDWLDGRHIEQKPAEWDDYTKTNLGRAIQIIKDARGTLHGYQTDDGIYECDKAIEALEHFLYRGLEIEKSAEWSEEDKDKVVQYLHDRDGGMLWSKATEITRDILDMLRPSWEPSEEQMTELFHALIPGAEYDCDILQELYFGLKSWLDSIRERPEQK